MGQPNVEGSGAPDYRPGVPTFGEIVERTLALLERRRRVSHTALRLEFALDDATFAALREELVDVLGAADDDGRVPAARNGTTAERHAPPAPAPPDRDLVTVLLCDLAASAALDALDAEARAAITTRLHAICREVAARRRGHVQPSVSDGVAIFFGHRRAADDDALRAVRCGWEILRTLDGDRAGALRGAQTAVALARRSGAAGWERRAAATLTRVSGVAPVA